MTPETFHNQPRSEQLAYAQFLREATAPRAISTYKAGAAQFGYPPITQEAIDSYMKGVDKDTDAQTLELVRALTETAMTSGMYERKGNGQDLADDRYTKGDDPDGAIFNKAEALKMAMGIYSNDTSGMYTQVWFPILSKPEPPVLVNYYEVLKRNQNGASIPDETPVFKSGQYPVIAQSTSNPNLSLKMDHYVDISLKEKNAAHPFGQSVHLLESFTNLVSGATQTTATIAMMVDDSSISYQQLAPILGEAPR